jgi:hypothetical protein
MIDNDCKCLNCNGTEYEQGEAIVLTYLFDLGYDLPRDSYSEQLWGVRERLLKDFSFRFKLPLKEINK